MRLHDFQVLSFDCYGTLIDWETGITEALEPMLDDDPPDPDFLLESFARLESAQQAATPGMPYPELLAGVHRQLAAELRRPTTPKLDAAFGASVPDWPAFPDSADALRYLKQHFRLIILSNIDRASFAASTRRLGVAFDAVFTAEDIGSYKPDPANFAYLLEHAGSPPETILHTAQSLFHDHVPARHVNLATAWIDRRHAAGGWGATSPAERTSYDFRFETLEEMAEAHRAEEG